MTKTLSKTAMNNFFKTHPKLAEQAQQLENDRLQQLEAKRPYYSFSKVMLDDALTTIAQAHGLAFKKITKTKYAFTNPKTNKTASFLFANGKDYTIDPKDEHDLSNFIAKSWHVLDKTKLEKQTADFFVFFISRRIDNKLWAITFDYPTLKKMIQQQTNFYFGITKDNKLIENRLQKEKMFDSKNIGLEQIFQKIN